MCLVCKVSLLLFIARVYRLHCTVYSAQCTDYIVQCILYNRHYSDRFHTHVISAILNIAQEVGKKNKQCDYSQYLLFYIWPSLKYSGKHSTKVNRVG